MIKNIIKYDGVKILMSNAKVKLVEDNFVGLRAMVMTMVMTMMAMAMTMAMAMMVKKKKFNIEDVLTRRAINSKILVQKQRRFYLELNIKSVLNPYIIHLLRIVYV